MKKTIIAAAALVAMVGCNKSIIETAPAEGYGYINLGVTADTEMVVTKADETTPVYNDYYVTLYGTSTDWTKSFNTIVADDWKVPAGDYTITVANYQTKDAAYSANSNAGDKYILGVGTVTVEAGLTKECEVACSVKNSKVSFISSQMFKEVFSSASVSVKASETRTVSMTVAETHSDDVAAYFEPTTLTWTLTATAKLDNKARTYTKSFITAEAKWTQVEFTTGNTDGQINVTITVNGEITQTETLTETVDPFEGTEI